MLLFFSTLIKLCNCIYLLIVQLGGPTWGVQLGRRDSTTASLSAANSQLPSPLMDLSDLISAFSNKGLSAKEMLLLSGTHSHITTK